MEILTHEVLVTYETKVNTKMLIKAENKEEAEKKAEKQILELNSERIKDGLYPLKIINLRVEL